MSYLFFSVPSRPLLVPIHLENSYALKAQLLAHATITAVIYQLLIQQTVQHLAHRLPYYPMQKKVEILYHTPCDFSSLEHPRLSVPQSSYLQKPFFYLLPKVTH